MDPRLHQAAKSGDVHLLKKLMDENPRLLLKMTPLQNTALHVAVRFGHEDFVIEVYSRYKSLLTQPNLEGDTRLHIAARSGYFSISVFLIAQIISTSSLPFNDLENGRNEALEKLRLGNRDNNTALHEAVRNNHVEIVKILILADPDLPCFSNNGGESPLYLAARKGSVEIVDQILQTSKSSAHCGPNGRTALHVAIVNKHFDIMEILLSVKPQLLNEADANGKIPLHYAASLGNRKIVGRLLGFDTSTAYLLDKDGYSPLHVAASQGHTGVVAELIHCCPDSGEMLDLSGCNVLHIACKSGEVNVVTYALETMELEGLINQKDNDGNTPLHVAAIYRRSKIIHSFLRDKRVDRWGLNNGGQTAMEIDQSIEESSISLLKVLISRTWRQRRAPQSVPSKVENNMKLVQEEATATTQTYKNMGNTLLVIATLIATITFAAALTMPGGYNNDKGPDQGMATLTASSSLKGFAINDTIAFTCSITAVFLLCLGAFSDHESYLNYFICSTVLIFIALQSTIFTFSAGLTTVLRCDKTLATVVFVIALFGPYAYVITCSTLFQSGLVFFPVKLKQLLVSHLCKLSKVVLRCKTKSGWPKNGDTRRFTTHMV